MCVCQACELTGAIEHVGNISHLVISDVYIKHNIPLIITDATDNWAARRLFSLEFLSKVQHWCNDAAMESVVDRDLIEIENIASQ